MEHRIYRVPPEHQWSTGFVVFRFQGIYEAQGLSRSAPEHPWGPGTAAPRIYILGRVHYHCAVSSMRRLDLIQRQIQLEHVHPRLAQQAKLPAGRMAGNQLVDPRL